MCEFGDSARMVAAMNGHLETVKWLIENGCSLNEKKMTATEIQVCCLLQKMKISN